MIPATAIPDTGVLIAINLTDSFPPPDDAQVRIISRGGKTIAALIIPASWTDPPDDAVCLDEPSDANGRRLERQLRDIGLTKFQFHNYAPGANHAPVPS